MKIYSRAMLLTLVLVMFSNVANGALIADFTADFQINTPKPGWAYQRTNPGAIGSEGYTNLVYAVGYNWYTTTGGQYGGAGNNDFQIIGSGFIHPGNGNSVNTTQDRFTVAQFTLSTSGPTTIDNLALNVQSGGNNGIELFVNVNNGPDLIPLANRIVAGGASYTGPSTFNLGTLSAGTRIYVAVGPNTQYNGDSSNLQFQINQVPEPGSLSLLAVGAALLFVRRRQARR